MEFSHDQVKQIIERIEDRLVSMRKKKKEFYSECGLSSAAYSQWNTGKNTPSRATLMRVADYLGVSYDWLVFGKEEEAESNYPLREHMRSEMRILFDAAEDAPASAILEAAALIMRYKEQNE